MVVPIFFAPEVLDLVTVSLSLIHILSIELPLKISVWEDKNGSVWATFPLMKPMAANYGLENEPVIEKMQTLLENIVIKSASVY